MSLAIAVNIDDIASRIRRAASEAIGGSEEDLRVGVEKILGELVLDPLGLPLSRYEVATKRYGSLITGARIDALHGQVVIEYEKPHSLENRKTYEHAIQQVKEGILRHAQGDKGKLTRYFGVALDGFSIGFVRYRQRLSDFEINKDPVQVNRSTVARLVEAIVGLKRKALDAEELLKDFGPHSELSQKTVRILYDALSGKVSNRTSILFKDWKRVFSQVCAYDAEKLKGLEEEYGFKREQADVERLLFSLHSYFALLMKLLAAEVGSLYWPIMGSYLKALENAYYKGVDRLKDQLRELEEGGLFAKLGISNFLEGDYFAWYLDEWSSEIAGSVTMVVKKLSDYDPSTAELEPDKIKDLFKRLYQNLVPRRIRHDLGEFYTPDWLAELVLDEAGYLKNSSGKNSSKGEYDKDPLSLRVLDPACGSGTFLILAIRRLREYVDEHWVNKGTALRQITQNVVGFDLNPLAVMASRANYLISIGDMLREKGAEQIEIPIYLADSILVERKTTVLGTSTYAMRTVAGEFRIPISIVDKGALGQALNVMEQCVKLGYTPREFVGLLEKNVRVDEMELTSLRELYDILAKLEKDGKNRIWIRVLKNSFAPLLRGRFDYVIGNPPWVNWESLPEDYRVATKTLWERYGLIRKTSSSELGRTRRDLATLFIARCFDQYTAKTGTLAFLLPFNVLRTQGGDGFRTYVGTKTQLQLAQDLSETYPFEGATNRAGLLVLTSGVTSFPVRCKVWTYGKSQGIPQEWGLNEVLAKTRQTDFMLAPIEARKVQSPWAIATEEAFSAIRKIVSRSSYDAREGLNPALTGVYWVNIKAKVGDGVVIENLGGQKKEVERVEDVVEPSLVYPLLRGRDVKKWYSEPGNYIVVPHDRKSGDPIPERRMKVDFPKTYRFFMRFRRALENRSIHKLWGKESPFYSVYGIGNYSFQPHKVVWKDISGKISARAEFGGATVVKDIADKNLGKTRVMADGTLMFIPCRDEDEAHYLAGMLNCSTTRLIVTSYAVLHVRGHVLKYVGIRKFDPSNTLHRKIADLSKEAHRLATQYNEGSDGATIVDDLKRTEAEIEKNVAKTYGLTESEMDAAKKSLVLLMGGEESATADEAD